jgi:hypothetical protein
MQSMTGNNSNKGDDIYGEYSGTYCAVVPETMMSAAPLCSAILDNLLYE